MTEPRQVEQGVHLLFANYNGPARYELWSVKAVRRLKSGDAKVTLLRHIGCAVAEATATFPDGAIRDPFRLVELSQADLKTIWQGTAT